MREVSMLDFRRDPKSVIRRVEHGEELNLTYRGRPVMRLAPVEARTPPDEDDPFYNMAEHAEDDLDSMPDRDMDRLLYGA